MTKTAFILLILSAVIISVRANHHDFKDTLLDDKIEGYCPDARLKAYDGRIIDIKKSLRLGAKLMKGLSVPSRRVCIEKCCSESSKCDLALYRRKETSATGHNCYYVYCGDFSNCVLAKHDNFESFQFIRNSYGGYGEPSANTMLTTHQGTGREHADGINHKVPHSLHPYKEVLKPTPSSTTNIIEATTINLIHSSSSIIQQKTSTSISTLSSSSSSSVVVNAKPTPSLAEGEVTHVNSTDIMSSGDHMTPEDNHVIPDSDNVLPHDKDRPCWKSGCHDTMKIGDLIAGVIVSVVTLSFLFVVAGLIIRKFYQNRQLKHYHNVDYLINGMYT